jgi:hypothetical protein
MTRFFDVAEIESAWAQASARCIGTAMEHPYVERLAAVFVNGTVVHAEFEVDLAPGVFALAAHYENWKHSRLLERFWMLPGVAERLPPLGDIYPGVAEAFHTVDFYHLVAELARRARVGGAYRRGIGPASSFLELATSFAETLVPGEAGAILVAESAWCRHFFDVAWDHTVVTVMPETRRIQVLLATDTD